MSTEVIAIAASLTFAAQTVAQTTAFHQACSVYVKAPAASPNAAGSSWTLYGVSGAGAVNVILARGILSQAGSSEIVLQNVDTLGATTVKLVVVSPNGAAASVVGALVGFDPSQAIASADANGSVTLNGAEQDVCTLSGGFPLVNVNVDASADANSHGSIWSLYALSNGIRTLVERKALVRPRDPQTGNFVGNPLPVDLFGDVVTGSDSYVLTARQPNGLAGLALVKGSIVGSSQSGSPGPGSIVTLAGNVTGPSNSNIVVKLSGDATNHAVLVDAGSFVGFDPTFANLPTVGDLRWGDISTARVLMAAEFAGANAALWQTDGAGTMYVGDNSGKFVSLFLYGSSIVSMQNGSGSQLGIPGTSFFRSYGLPGFQAQVTGGSFFFDTDASATSVVYKLNGNAIVTFTGADFKVTTAAGIVTADFQNGSFQVGSASQPNIIGDSTLLRLRNQTTDVLTVSSTQVALKKGWVDSLRTSATSTTMTASDTAVELTATGQVITLPTSPVVGQRATTMYSRTQAADTWGVTSASNMSYQGTTTLGGGTKTITMSGSLSATNPNKIDWTWDGAQWVGN